MTGSRYGHKPSNKFSPLKETRFFSKNKLCQFCILVEPQPFAKYQKKLMNRLQDIQRQTDEPMDRLTGVFTWEGKTRVQKN